MKIRISAISFLFFMACSTMQAEDLSNEFVFQLGGDFQLSKQTSLEDKSKITTVGPSGGVQVFSFFEPYLAYGIDFTYSRSGPAKVSTPILNTNAKIDSIVLMSLLKLRLFPSSQTWPYITLGAGVHTLMLKLDATPVNGFTWPNSGTSEARTLSDDAGSSYAVSLGAGVDIPINDRMFFGFEGRYTYLGKVSISVSNGNAAPASIDSDAHLFNALVDLGYKF